MVWANWGPCIVLGPFLRETRTRIYYRCQDKEAWVNRSSRLLEHVAPCPLCPDV
jgi:hypothetical protein